MMIKIYILLPVYNRREVTRQLIECLKSQTYQQYHLILIDDGSADGTKELVQSEISALTVIKGRGNWWWAGSLHQGYLWLKKQNLSGDDLVLILNDDTTFEKDFLEKGISLIESRKRTLLLAQCYSKKTGKLIDTGLHVNWKKLSFEITSIPEQINCLSTRGLIFHVSDFFEIGGFHPRLLPHYASDYEFTIRAFRKGIKLTTDPLFKLWLDESLTGYHQLAEESFIVFLKKYFSMKSVANPFIWTSFIALSCPWPWKLLNWIRIWRNSAYLLFKSMWKRTL